MSISPQKYKPVGSLKYVGPKTAIKLYKLGIRTEKDLILYFPRAYRDFTNVTKIGNLNQLVASNWNSGANTAVTIQGTISQIGNKKTSRRRLTVTEAVIEDGTGSLKVIWFNQSFLPKMVPIGSNLILNGKVSYNFYSKELILESPERTRTARILPTYPETEGITSKFLQKLVLNSSDLIADIEEWLPLKIARSYKLLAISEALRELHFPTSMENVREAQRRIAFDELFTIALKANISKAEIKRENAPGLSIDDQGVANFVKTLPFELTGDQKKSAWQILQDMREHQPMNRLLNGDVGSGKTIVAAIGAFAALKAGYKAVLMAPTSILANQHFETFCNLFAKENISVGLWTRESKKVIKNSKFENLNCQLLDADVIIGTHALLQDKIDVDSLGLVIIDEQHRFGVEQRAKLMGARKDGLRPHFLSMTATPIPRTLHLALFGDLDLSLIKTKPSDRKEIKTRLVEGKNRQKAYEFIRNLLKNGRQAFVICPLIEIKTEAKNHNQEVDENFSKASFDESLSTSYQLLTTELDERKTVKDEFQKLKVIFPEFKIGILHGKMKSTEKSEVMAKFKEGELNILVSTSVVEVGVDIPNASVIVIEDAERFGLAQLHQFRGRVGRADHQSYCFLFSSTMSQKALSRLKSLEVTSDGFKLAEIDLETRGPGAIFGTEQSGLLNLKMASLADHELISQASTAAKELVAEDSELKNYPLLRERITEFLANKHLE